MAGGPFLDSQLVGGPPGGADDLQRRCCYILSLPEAGDLGVLFAEMLAPERVERGAGIHPFSPAILMPSLVRNCTLVALDP
jgi:hypothetical protein